VTVRLARFLDAWLDEQPEPRGQVLAGEAGIVLRRGPDTVVGVDVAYVSAEVMDKQASDSTLIEGAPTLAAEILSPSDTVEDIKEKIDAYLSAGVAIVWIVDPHFRTVTVHRPRAEPELFNVRQEITAEPQLPGFRVPVARFFE
jgi:Uma2 family endonuclease